MSSAIHANYLSTPIQSHVTACQIWIIHQSTPVTNNPRQLYPPTVRSAWAPRYAPRDQTNSPAPTLTFTVSALTVFHSTKPLPITSIPQDMALLPIPAETNTHPSAYGTVPCPHPHPPPRPSAQLQFPITITHPQFTHSHSPNVQLCERRQPDWWLRLGDRLSQLTEN